MCVDTSVVWMSTYANVAGILKLGLLYYTVTQQTTERVLTRMKEYFSHRIVIIVYIMKSDNLLLTDCYVQNSY